MSKKETAQPPAKKSKSTKAVEQGLGANNERREAAGVAGHGNRGNLEILTGE